MKDPVLVINAGSSSIKFQLFEAVSTDDLDQIAGGQFEGIGTKPHFVAKNADGEKLVDRYWEGDDGPKTHRGCMQVLIDWIGDFLDGGKVAAVGHRVVHGGELYSAPVKIDGDVHEKLESLISLAPLHQPHNLKAIDAMAVAYPGVPQVACFDTAFHQQHPWVADTYALPRRYYDEGIQRYGFHGLSYEFIAREMRKVAPHIASGKMVVCHLGNGASMCAIDNGRSMDSTMGFTAVDGLPMGTRTGQLDPGVVLHFIDELGMTTKEVTDLIYKQSGLLGLSGVSNDMRELEGSDNPHAKDAIDYFTFHIRRNVGALAAAMGGLDGVVFTGGIGENSVRIRREVCTGLEFLGIRIDDAKNEAKGPKISSDDAGTEVWVIKTNEEKMIALHALAVLSGERRAAA
ncbi:MAG: acetate/propionate family kinase [Geminicoccaceae bacterium]